VTTALQITDLSVGYRNRPVLHGVDLGQIDPGTVLGVLGQNAAGKSTLLKALAGQLRFGGAARFGGRSIGGLTPLRLGGIVGYLPQTPPQPTGLLVYEVMLGTLRACAPGLVGREIERRIETAFAQMNLTPHAMDPVEALSGGKRQLLGLATVLARRVPVLLLDEPTSALDLRWQIETLTTVREEARGRGAIVLVALHDLNLAMRFCDRVAVLGDGTLLASGPAEATLTTSLLRRAYGIDARLERSSKGEPIIIADSPNPTSFRPEPMPTASMET